MIVNQEFLDEIAVVSQLDQEDFERTLNFTISYIAKSDISTKLNEVLEMEEEVATQLLAASLRLVAFFAKFNASEREFKAHLDIISSLSAEKKALFTFRMKESEKHLRKTLGLLERDNELEYSNLKWRFDLQVSSRSNEEEAHPKIMLQLDLANTSGATETKLMETDYANLKHLYEELNNALKLHDSLAQRRIQKKFI